MKFLSLFNLSDKYFTVTFDILRQMSDVELATRYAAENYPLALNNLAKRYRNSETGEPIHYSELGFGEISDQQAKAALRFFADIELIENPKGANYTPSQSVIDWQLKMGETSKEGKRQVYETLQDYEVFDELNFVLQESEGTSEQLAEQVGGMVGIDEDELSDMKKTIGVFIECGFFKLDSEGKVGIADDLRENEEAEEVKTKDTVAQQPPEKSTSAPSPSVAEQSPGAVDDGIGSSPQAQATLAPQESVPASIKTNVEITFDATKMDPEDLEEKLKIINDHIANDGE